MQILAREALPSFRDERSYVRVVIGDEDGAMAIGEATPWPTEPAYSIRKMADRIEVALALIGLVQLHRRPLLEAVEHALESADALLQRWNCARFAVETALLDLAAQRMGKPLGACLTDFAGHPSVPCNALLDAATDDLAAKAAELAKQGRTAIKVKLRARDEAGFVREVEALRAMRKVWPGELRLDPNGAWTIEEARSKLRTLAEFSPRYVEQPVPAKQLPDLGPTACPWAADESLLVPGLPERLAKSGACAAFILKPALLGGIGRALSLWKLAKSEGIPAITTHALDGPVGIAAAFEFARALPGEPEACGLDHHAGLSRYPFSGLERWSTPGSIVASTRPGLGISEIDRRRWAMPENPT